MLLFNDGFDHYGTNAALLLNGVYAESNGVTLSAINPRTGPRCARISMVANDVGLRLVLKQGPAVHVGACYAFSINKLPTNNRDCFMWQWRDADNVPLASVLISSTGQVLIINGGHKGPVLAASNPVIFARAYQHFEAAATEDGIEVRINGVTVASTVSGVARPVAQVKLGGNSYPLVGASGVDMDVDDFNVWSGEGDENNDFMGDVKVYTRFNSSDGLEQDWIPSVGSQGFPMLDNVPPIDATEYLTAGPDSAPARSTFGISAFPDEIVSIRGVTLSTRAFKTDAGNAKIRTGVISAAVEVSGEVHAISQAPIWYQDVFEVDPATATVWTLPALNALNTVLERTE